MFFFAGSFVFYYILLPECLSNLQRLPEHGSVHRPFWTKNTPRSPCGERGAKTKLVFTAARSLQKQVLCSRRSKVSASRPYAPDTRGVCFQGPSRALWYLISRCGASHGTKHRPGSEISQNACGGCCTSAHRLLGWMRFSASYRCIAQ